MIIFMSRWWGKKMKDDFKFYTKYFFNICGGIDFNNAVFNFEGGVTNVFRTCSRLYQK